MAGCLKIGVSHSVVKSQATRRDRPTIPFLTSIPSRRQSSHLLGQETPLEFV